MTPEFYEATEYLDEAVRRRMREAGISDYNKALNDLRAENDPAYLAYEAAHPNPEARKGAFIVRKVRDGFTRAEALDEWERHERRLSAAASGRASFRLSRALADGIDIAIPVD